MFGVYRTVLALMVVGQHVWGLPTGGVGVQAFFCLSGFLMTLVMCGTYRGRPLAFVLNRILRLYPSYWMASAVTAAIILWYPIPEMIGQGRWQWGLPTDPVGITKNVLFIAREHELRLVPTAWAVANELLFYALIAAGFTQTLRRSVACFVAALAISLFALEDPRLYFSPLGAALPFATGALLYHVLRLPFAERLRRSPLLPAGALALAVIAGSVLAGDLSSMLRLYLAMFATVPLIWILFNLRPKPLSKAADEFIGRLSYPIYLLHFLPLLILCPHPPFWIEATWFRPAVLAITLISSLGVVLLIDIPIDRWRRRIKMGGHGGALPRRSRVATEAGLPRASIS